MAEEKVDFGIPDELVISRILLIRGKRVMIDTDIAELYGVATKRLNEQVKRNSKRFPGDFMFVLTLEEKHWLVEHNAHLNKLKFSSNLPLAFTEHGAVMLASILNSERAIEVNIQIVRIFTNIREMLFAHRDILLKLERIENQTSQHSQDIQYVFDVLSRWAEEPEEPREQIGFKFNNEQG